MARGDVECEKLEKKELVAPSHIRRHLAVRMALLAFMRPDGDILHSFTHGQRAGA